MDGLSLASQHHVQEQTEALHDEAESHQAQHRAVPGKQGALGGKKYTGVVEVGHDLSCSIIFGQALILD
jgi:hypothetical protein